MFIPLTALTLQYHLLAFIASLLRITDEDTLSEIAQYDTRYVFECFHCFQRNSLFILFAITAAGVVPCGAPKKSLRTSPIVQFILYIWAFEISGTILRI